MAKIKNTQQTLSKTTTNIANYNSENATKIDLAQIPLTKEIDLLRIDIKNIKNEFIKSLIILFLVQTLAIVSALKYFIN